MTPENNSTISRRANSISGPHSDRRGHLGLKELFAASIGVIVSQISMVSILQGIGLGGWGFVFAMFLAFAIAIANAMAYAEMALMIPTAGSIGSYAEAAIGNFPAILLVFSGYIATAIFGVPAELMLLNEVVDQAFSIKTSVYMSSIPLIAVLTVLNIFGADVFARLQTLLSVFVLTFLLVCGITSISGHAASPEITGGMSAGFANLGSNTSFVSVVALAFWTLMGSEFVTPLIPEARNPNRDLPIAMLGGLALIFAAEIAFGIGAAVLIPREHLVTSGAPHLEYILAVAGPTAARAFACLAVFASASLLNTLLASIPRMLAGMSENGQVFPAFKRTHPRFRTPIVGILFVAVLPIIGLVWSHGSIESILPLTVAASVAWLLAYVMAQISLMVLRTRHPRAIRPYRFKGYPFVSWLAVFVMVFVIFRSSPEAALTEKIITYTGIVLGVFAIVGGAWVKFFMKKGLFEPVIPSTLRERA